VQTIPSKQKLTTARKFFNYCPKLKYWTIRISMANRSMQSKIKMMMEKKTMMENSNKMMGNREVNKAVKEDLKMMRTIKTKRNTMKEMKKMINRNRKKKRNLKRRRDDDLDANFGLSY